MSLCVPLYFPPIPILHRKLKRWCVTQPLRTHPDANGVEPDLDVRRLVPATLASSKMQKFKFNSIVFLLRGYSQASKCVQSDVPAQVYSPLPLISRNLAQDQASTVRHYNPVGSSDGRDTIQVSY